MENDYSHLDMSRVVSSIDISRKLGGYDSPIVAEADRFLVESGLVSQALVPLSKLSTQQFMNLLDEIQVKIL